MLYFLDSQLAWLPGDAREPHVVHHHMPEWASWAGILFPPSAWHMGRPAPRDPGIHMASWQCQLTDDPTNSLLGQEVAQNLIVLLGLDFNAPPRPVFCWFFFFFFFLLPCCHSISVLNITPLCLSVPHMFGFFLHHLQGCPRIFPFPRTSLQHTRGQDSEREQPVSPPGQLLSHANPKRTLRALLGREEVLLESHHALCCHH